MGDREINLCFPILVELVTTMELPRLPEQHLRVTKPRFLSKPRLIDQEERALSDIQATKSATDVIDHV